MSFLMILTTLNPQARKLSYNTHDSHIKLANMTISELLDVFPDNFIQCHRKYIINLHHFYSYDKSTFIIQVGKHSIPLGRKHKKIIEERLHL